VTALPYCAVILTSILPFPFFTANGSSLLMAEKSTKKLLIKNTMENYRSLKLGNRYTENDINVGFRVLNTAGILTKNNGDHIVLNFDVVDMRYIESQRNQTDELLANVLDELLKIRSFSSANGKIVFKSFNKDKRVSDKTENRKKRLGYEAFLEKNNKT